MPLPDGTQVGKVERHNRVVGQHAPKRWHGPVGALRFRPARQSQREHRAAEKAAYWRPCTRVAGAQQQRDDDHRCDYQGNAGANFYGGRECENFPRSDEAHRYRPINLHGARDSRRVAPLLPSGCACAGPIYGPLHGLGDGVASS
jgi:hypothetical protein